jgi:hypothetical protein
MGTATDELKLDIAIATGIDVIDITKTRYSTYSSIVSYPSRTEVSA